jgi:hypothetical protein
MVPAYSQSILLRFDYTPMRDLASIKAAVRRDLLLRVCRPLIECTLYGTPEMAAEG